MNIFSYIDKYGDYSFEEFSFNEIDNVIFSSLAYINLDNFVCRNSFIKRKISEVGHNFFKSYNKRDKNMTAVKVGIKALRYIMDTKRYKDLLLYNYSYIGDDEQQFSAVTIEINSSLVYVSFEGTDHLISGWMEDFMMMYKFPVLAQKRAIDYLNKHFLFNRKEIIVGGHSKGGNLAMVASMYAYSIVKNKIITIYNNDGPGLRKKELESKNYASIKDRLIHIIPSYSWAGLLLRHSDDYIVIKSTKRSLSAHDMATWVVRGDSFLRDNLSDFSKILDEGLTKWSDKYSDIEIEKIVKGLFLIFDKAGIVSLIDVMNNKRLILKLIKEAKDLDKDTRVALTDLLVVILNYFRDVKIEPLFEKWGKK